jgi:hypothetical protein
MSPVSAESSQDVAASAVPRRSTDDTQAGGLVMFLSVASGLLSIALGGISPMLWILESEWVILALPLALLAIVFANLALALWWIVGSIDIRIHIIGLTLGVFGLLGCYFRSEEFPKMVAEVHSEFFAEEVVLPTAPDESADQAMAAKGDQQKLADAKKGAAPDTPDVPEEEPDTPDVFSHETKADTVAFLGGPDDANPARPPFKRPYDTYLFDQATSSKPLPGEWLEESGKRPEWVVRLTAGTRLRSLKVKNARSRGGFDAIHYIEVVTGEHKGACGWIAGKEITEK